MKPKQKPHYVNNKEFSQAVVDYVKIVNQAEADGKQLPVVPDYIAQCFLKIAQGLSHKANFIRYTYREEMVMDAVENCLKAITNYNIDAATRTGNPNAFAYFTQICYYAFLRRLAKEKKQQDIKFKYIEKAGIEDFIFSADTDAAADSATRAFVDQLRDRISVVKQNDATLKEFAKEEKKKTKTEKPKGLELFMGA
tara:strand:- start:11980 stop:12567 length:588 start_codon:yes stop_codon:yes gene_type:complete